MGTASIITSTAFESGERVAFTYDSLDRLTGEKHVGASGQAISQETYGFDLAGNRTNKTVMDTAGSPLITVNYSLPTGNRLGSWSVAETNLAGQVDVAGVSSELIGTNDRFGWLYVSNAATSVRPLVSGTNFCVYDFTVGLGTQKIVAAIRDAAGNMGYATNTIVLSVVTNGAYQYSAAGCVTNIQYKGKDYQQSFALTWDSQYRLTAVSTNSGDVERYGYDPLGTRAWTWDSPNGTNWHAYDGAQVVADLNSTGGLVRAYTYGPGIDNLLAITIYGGTASVPSVFYCLRDHLGSILALADTNGVLVESYRYDAWGRPTVFDAGGNILSESAVGNRFLWQGREYSWRTGLYYFRARWYDPVTGRWLSNDPIGISGGLNQYVFCANNPVNFRDPWGLCESDDTPSTPPIALIPGTVIGPQSPGRMPPQPPRYSPRTWPRILTDGGPGLKNPDGRYWFPHPEDQGHWRHRDIEDWSKRGGGPKTRWPPNSIKPWPNQKRGLNPNQSWNDPSGDAPPFEMPMSPGMNAPGFMPFMVTPAPGIAPAPITIPSFGFGPVFAPVFP